MFNTILIANRGEIACRIIRTARALGYRTVAVFSAADAGAPHVALADQAVNIGAAPAAESYLRRDALLAAARATGAGAIHPGYGFLSENADFAQAVRDAGLVFIGPPPAAIAVMGDKSRAKACVAAAGVPVVPGGAANAAEAARIGFPLLVKAVAGGGGRGMRLVEAPEALEAAMHAAAREAQSAFGDGALMLERFIPRGRHIEIQIFGDSQGNIIHLGERDCTAQRRRQKIIEEAPSPIVTPALRARMGADAVNAARAVGYQGAGTVEFILDADANYYFLEMNTRLQVEHPVTEAVTGLDLVAWQLRVAAGEPLPLSQDDITFTGHAIEARLCAEDPFNNFAPQTGPVLHWRPQPAPGIRIDAGIAEGGAITPFYDPMIAKFIAHGATRAEATSRLIAALRANPLFGVTTNAAFLIDLLQTPEFTAASMHTGMVDEWSAAAAPILAQPETPRGLIALAAALIAAPQTGFRNRGPAIVTLKLQTGDTITPLTVITQHAVSTVHDGDHTTVIQQISRQGRELVFTRDAIQGHAIFLQHGATLHLAESDISASFTEILPGATPPPAPDPSRLIAPVSGTLLSILPAGAEVAAGDIVAVIEAMKIETRIPALSPGRIARTRAAPGAQITAKTLLAELDIPEAS